MHSPDGIAQVLARYVGRVLFPKDSREPLAMVGTRPVEEQVAQEKARLLVGEAFQRVLVVTSLRYTKESQL